MKAVALDRFGGPEVLYLHDVPLPAYKPNEVLIRVKSAGINFGDTVIRQGGAPIAFEFPLILGSEVTGIVEQVGADVAHLAVGDRVSAPLFLASQLGGGYAEFAVLDADVLTSIPRDISFDQAAALSMQGLTAWAILRQFDVNRRRVLIHAAAGGVGLLLLQLAKLRGAHVVATAGSEEKLRLIRRLGADAAINYRDDHWVEQVRTATHGTGPDFVFDSVGGDVRRLSLEVLAPFGTLVIYGGSSGGAAGYASDAIEVSQVAGIMMRNQSVAGFSLWPILGDRAGVRTLLAQCYAELFELVRLQRLETVIGARYALRDAREAHRKLESRTTVGKVILHNDA